MDDNSIDVIEKDKRGKFARATSCSTRGTNPLQWSRANHHRYSTFVFLSEDLLSIQSSSVARERTLSQINRLVDEARLRMNAETITAPLLLKSWNRLLS